MIVFDSLVRFHEADENSAKQMAEVFGKLRSIAEVGATAFLIHHQGKSRTSLYRGSSDILAGVDAAFEIREEKSKNATILTLECFKHRFIEEPRLTMRFDLENGCFEVVEDKSLPVTADQVEKICRVIAKNPGINQEQLLKQAGLPETNGRKLLNEDDGKHWFSKPGKGKSFRYFLPKPKT